MSFTLLSLLLLQAAQPAPIVNIDRDNIEIRESCTVRVAAAHIADTDGNGVVQITGDNITVDFAGQNLHDATAAQTADIFTGIGIRITGKNVTVRNANVSGYKAGIWATRADGLTIEDCDVSGNFRQRLYSTAATEDERDWLWPHQNDDNQWLKNYGSGIYIDDSQRVTVRRCRARRGQNGLCLRRVDASEIYDNDFSFLSGWGIALFRCSNNTISHNSCDFCVRGYSHGVYSRGQDSAGILMFEQCCENVVASNSATHSGDGFFGYAGHEALDNGNLPKRAGNNENVLFGNDFSFAPAIGIEMTFSFENKFYENTLCGGNYGIWGGYSSDTDVGGNTIEDNILAGIAVEHGSSWNIRENGFRDNATAIELWWDEDADLLAKPWAKKNRTASSGFLISSNRFDGDKVVLVLRKTTGVRYGLNREQRITERHRLDGSSELDLDESFHPTGSPGYWKGSRAERRARRAPGERQALGARPHLAGRDKIIMTEWGPYDWEAEAPYLHRVPDEAGSHVYQILGSRSLPDVQFTGAVQLTIMTGTGRQRVFVTALGLGTIAPYTLTLRSGATTLERRGTIVAATWKIAVFGYQTDPREDLEAWQCEAAHAVTFERPALDLPYDHGGPSDLAGLPPAATAAALPKDRFGTIATTKLTFPAGRWRIVTMSDDGVRVFVDDRRVIDNWTHHGPTEDKAEVTFDQPTQAEIRVEHFELDGYAILSLRIEPVE